MEKNCEGYLIIFLGFKKGFILRATVRKNRPVNGELKLLQNRSKTALRQKERLFIIDLYT